MGFKELSTSLLESSVKCSPFCHGARHEFLEKSLPSLHFEPLRDKKPMEFPIDANHILTLQTYRAGK